jgi:Cu(I)-responsive transcriptional regulator
MDTKELLRIGDLAKATGTKVVTIRYYEQIGLLPVPSRTDGNYRSYSEEHLRRLRFVRRCRDLGFTLGQVRELLHLSLQQSQQCAEVDRITAQHLGEIERKIADLNRLAGELRRLSACCEGEGLIADCRIIEALSPELPERTG